MSLVLTVFFASIGIFLGKVIFKKWVNHLTIYSFIWGWLVFLYELKLLPYVDITPLTWFIVIIAYLCYLLGILTIVSINNYKSNKPLTSYLNENVSLPIFIDNGRTLKIFLIIFCILGFYSAIQNWLVLIEKFGSIPSVFLNANKIYRMNQNAEIKGIIPHLFAVGYVAVFFSGIYTAYNRKFTILSFIPIIIVILKELAMVGRAGMLFAILEFAFSFFLFRHLLSGNRNFTFKKTNALIYTSILLILFITSISLIKVTRGSFENYTGTSRSLKQLEDNLILSPSLYLYLSSDVGVLSKYLSSEGEDTKIGQHTFMPVYGILSKFGLAERPPNFQKGYYIPMWTNTATYLRELHADFGITGVVLVPFLLGLIITLLWIKFYQTKSLIIFAILVFFYLIIGFSFLVMLTRLVWFFTSLFIILISIPIIEKIALLNSKGLLKLKSNE